MNKEDLIGKSIVVGFTYYSESGDYLDQTQFHGTIVDADENKGVRVFDEHSKEERTLPPRLDAIFPALPGLYREYTTDETIEDPDFISLWHVTKVPGSNDNWEWVPSKVDLEVKQKHAE